MANVPQSVQQSPPKDKAAEQTSSLPAADETAAAPETPGQAAVCLALAVSAVAWTLAGSYLVLNLVSGMSLGLASEATGLAAGLLAAYLWLGEPSSKLRINLTMAGAVLALAMLLSYLALAATHFVALPACLAAVIVLLSHDQIYVRSAGLCICMMSLFGSFVFGADDRFELSLGLSCAAAALWLAQRARGNRAREEGVERDQQEAALQQTIDKLRGEIDELNAMASPSQTLEVRGELDGMWDWNLQTDKVYLSPRWRSLLGYPDHAATMPSEQWLNLIHPYDLDEFLRRIGAHLDKKATIFECEHRVRQSDESYRWVLSSGRAIWDDEGRPERIAGSQVDIKRMKNYEAELVHQATHDRLTELPNRVRLLEQLTVAVRNHGGTLQDSFGVIFVDLDRFKAINDRMGHAAGDELLVEAARRIQAVCAAEDALVSRLGGDEFVVLVRHVRRKRALVLAEAIEESISEAYQIDGQDVRTSASIGVAMAEDDMQTPENLLRQADLAMYQAKADGKACVRFFEPDMEERAGSSINLLHSLNQALMRNEFELFYQPIVSLHTGRVESVEALIRWRKEDGRIVCPAEFIPLAEESDLIVEIGDWVLSEACRQIEEWSQAGIRPVKVSVNLSVKQLAEKGFAVNLRERLAGRGVRPDSLQLEITETGLLKELGSTVESLDRLILLGVGTAIDDFGTGYSSLSYLRRLNCDVVKMDQSFVQDLSQDNRAEALSRSIITMAHNLGLRVVAEGVETIEQLRVLRSQGCNFVQGYLIARPMPASKMTPFLESKWNLFHHFPSTARSNSTQPRRNDAPDPSPHETLQSG